MSVPSSVLPLQNSPNVGTKRRSSDTLTAQRYRDRINDELEDVRAKLLSNQQLMADQLKTSYVGTLEYIPIGDIGDAAVSRIQELKEITERLEKRREEKEIKRAVLNSTTLKAPQIATDFMLVALNDWLENRNGKAIVSEIKEEGNPSPRALDSENA